MQDSSSNVRLSIFSNSDLSIGFIHGPVTLYYTVLSGVDGFVGMENVGVDKYVADPMNITMTAATTAPTYLQPAGTGRVN